MADSWVVPYFSKLTIAETVLALTPLQSAEIKSALESYQIYKHAPNIVVLEDHKRRIDEHWKALNDDLPTLLVIKKNMDHLARILILTILEDYKEYEHLPRTDWGLPVDAFASYFDESEAKEPIERAISELMIDPDHVANRIRHELARTSLLSQSTSTREVKDILSKDEILLKKLIPYIKGADKLEDWFSKHRKSVLKQAQEGPPAYSNVEKRKSSLWADIRRVLSSKDSQSSSTALAPEDALLVKGKGMA